MKNLIFAVLLLPLVACADEVINFPGDHSNILSGHTWKQEVEHEGGYPKNNCRGSDSYLHSQCWIALSEGTSFPVGTTSVRLTLKAKAWTRNVGYQTDSYCLIYGYVLKNSTEHTNHLIHVEEWSPEIGYKDRRRVSYSNIVVPVVNGKVSLGAGKKIQGNCQVEFTVYLDGYVTAY
jgi:hypothetical protein